MSSRTRKSREPREPRKPAGLDGAAFQELARAVYHHRSLSQGKISPAQIDRILECARCTPSVANRQPWLLANSNGDAAHGLLLELARNPDAFEDFFAAHPGTHFVRDLHSAGALIVVLGQRSEPFWRESCLLVTHQILMAATAEGLAARAVLPKSPNALAQKIRVPDEYLAFMLVLLGHAGELEHTSGTLKKVSDLSVPLKTEAKTD
ncbi:MAG: nitroreductase family protein [Planctomycetes bacterium]|nr:nitroreductase family protein [Planctomycetota bacterium]